MLKKQCRNKPTLHSRPFRHAAAFALLAIALPIGSSAQSATATVAVGTIPAAVAVNVVTNKIYIANSGSNTVTVIDGARFDRREPIDKQDLRR